MENPGMERSAGGSKYPWEGAARRRCAWDWAGGEMAREVVPRRIAPNWGDLRKLPRARCKGKPWSVEADAYVKGACQRTDNNPPRRRLIAAQTE